MAAQMPLAGPRPWAGRPRVFWFWLLWFVLVIAFGFTALGGVRFKWFPPKTDSEGIFVYLTGFAFLVLLWYFISLLRGTPTLKHIFEGEDQLASTSKFQFFVWTAAVLYAYVSLYAARALRGDQDAINQIPRNLMIVMGLSIGTAIGAKAIAQTQGDNNSAPIKDTSQLADRGSLKWLVANDHGNPDLSKIQLVAWTFVAVGIFLLNTWDQIGKVLFVTFQPDLQTFCASRELTSALASGCGVLPNIDDALMVLMGLGTGTYLGTKLVSTSTPVISNLNPATGDEQTVIVLTGAGLGATQGGSSILIDDMPATVVPQNQQNQQWWSDTALRFSLPAQHPNGTSWSQLAARVIYFKVVVGGQTSNAVPFTYSPPPVLPAGFSLRVGKVGEATYNSGAPTPTGGKPPYKWSTTNPLPADLGLKQNVDTGEIVGTPLKVATDIVEMQVTDSLQALSNKVQLTLTINQ